MDASVPAKEFSKNEVLHYKPEFFHLSQGQECISLCTIREFLKGMKLSDHDVNNIIKLTCSSQIKLQNFVSAMRLCSLVKQGKKYSAADSFVEQKVLARKTRVNDPNAALAKAQMIHSKFPTRIQITDSEFIQSGWFSATSYYVYKIQSCIQGRLFEVKRRFSDLDWLHRCLSTKYKGLIIPALPNKRIINNTDSEFIEQRKLEMQEFLNLVRVHEVLGESEEFLAFLKLEESEFANLKQNPLKEDWFEIKGIRDTIDQTFAIIETKFQGYTAVEKNMTYSQYLRIEQEVTEKNENLKKVSQCFNEWAAAQESANESFLALLARFQITDEVNTLVKNTEDQMNKIQESINFHHQKINTLHNTLFVYQSNLDKKATAENILKRKLMNEATCLKKEEELVKAIDGECEEILRNLHTEYKSINKCKSEKFPLILCQICSTQHSFICSLKSSLKNVNH